MYFAQKTPDFGPKKQVTDLGGTPAPPFMDFFRQKGGYGFGGYPPPPFKTNSDNNAAKSVCLEILIKPEYSVENIIYF